MGDRNLFVYQIDDTGGLAPVAGSPFASGGRIDDVESLSASTELSLVFLANSVTHTISVLRQDTVTGALTPVPGSPFWAEGAGPSETAVNAAGTLDGRYLFVANALSNTVSAFELGSDGALIRRPGFPTPTRGSLIEGMTIHPLGGWIFVNNGNSSTVSVLKVLPGGALSPVPGSPFPGVARPDEIVLSPDGGLAFVTNRAAPASISVLSVGATGALTPIQGSPFAAPQGFSAYEHGVLNSTGTLLFAGFEIPPAVVSYQVATDGSLSLVSGTPLLLGTPGPGGPEGMAVDPSDRFLFVTDHITDRIHVFEIQPDGSLAVAVPGGVPVPAEPFDVLIPAWRVGGRPVLIVATRLR